MHHILTCLLFTLSLLQSNAQPVLESYNDGVYRDYIRSVRFHVNGLALTSPVAKLGLDDALFLGFDDLIGDGTRYYYTVIHCDRHWQPTSELSVFDYLGGYQEGEIREYEMSSGTYQHYLHYYVTLPNADLRWTHSGNYLLVVYEAGEQENPILTRRFLVVEDLVLPTLRVARPAVVSKQDTHQEADFTLNVEALRPQDPRFEISCTVLQNGRWDMSQQEIKPRLVSGYQLDYNYQDKIVFPAGKEFRQLDISSLRFRSENVLSIEEYSDGYSIILFTDEPRAYQAYLWRQDLNGRFVPFNRDFIRKQIPLDSLASTLNLVRRHNYREQALGTDYTEVLFTLNLGENFTAPVFIVGGMTDWKMLPDYQLRFDERTGMHTALVYLKQGYYNYGYAIPDANGQPDFSAIEGDWFATENEYTVLVYYRPRAGLYDRLVGARTFLSSE